MVACTEKLNIENNRIGMMEDELRSKSKHPCPCGSGLTSFRFEGEEMCHDCAPLTICQAIEMTYEIVVTVLDERIAVLCSINIEKKTGYHCDIRKKDE